MKNTNVSLEQMVARHVANETVAPPSDAFYDELVTRAHRHGQRPRWLAFIKEPPMRISSHVAVGSPTMRVAAIVVATLLLALAVASAGIAGSRLLAADGTIVVDANGEGTMTTITEAVAIADDGDTILVRPGTYEEAVVIDKDIKLSGDGDRESIIIAYDDGMIPVVTITDSDATLSNLTLTGERSQVRVAGGAPTLQDLVFAGVGIPFTGPGDPNAFAGLYLMATRAQVIGNTFIGGGEIGLHGASTPLIEGNTLSDGPHIYVQSAGEETVIRDNTISGTKFNGMGLESPGDYLIEGNTIIDAPSYGIGSSPIARSLTSIIRDNAISGSETAISMMLADSPVITGNELSGNGTAILMQGSEGLIDGNRIRDGEVGIVLQSGSPTVRGNDIEVTGRGIDVGPLAAGVVSGNTVCGGELSIHVAEDADATVTDNETC